MRAAADAPTLSLPAIRASPLRPEPSIGVTLVDGSDGCGGGSDRRVTHIDFVCDHDYAVGAPVFVSTDSDDVCVTNLEWRTRHACPLCNKASYAELVSACVDGTQTHSWVLADALCVGGVQPELDSGAACDTTEVPINHIAVKPTTAIVGIVAAVVVVVGGCVVIYVQVWSVCVCVFSVYEFTPVWKSLDLSLLSSRAPNRTDQGESRRATSQEEEVEDLVSHHPSSWSVWGGRRQGVC